MKIFIFIAFYVLSCKCQNPPNVGIAVGTPAKQGENLDFVLLSVVFQNQAQFCGGSLITSRTVLTTATCILDPIEQYASVVFATFPQSKSLKIRALKLVTHADFDSASYTNNIGLVILETAVVPDGKTIAFATLGTDSTADVYAGVTMRVCGFGSISNKPIPPKTLMCTDIFGVTAETCATMNPSTFCTEWSDKENNVCNGDYGGPVYTYSYSGKTITQTVVGIASFAPNVNPGLPCLSGHRVEVTQVAAYATFIDENKV